MARFFRSDPVEMRVLTGLAAGPASVDELAAQVGQPADVVSRILERAVAAGSVATSDLSGAPYSLTPEGLEAVGLYQGVQGAVDASGHVDYGAAARLVMEQYQASKEVATEEAVREQAAWTADDAARNRVSAALNDAYARGAITREQLDDRTGRALSATTMGELRKAGEGVIDLPPVLPSGLSGISVGGQGPQVQVNPALGDVRWRLVGYAAGLVLLGLFVLMFQALVGLAVVVAGLALGGAGLKPLLRTGRVRVTNR